MLLSICLEKKKTNILARASAPEEMEKHTDAPPKIHLEIQSQDFHPMRLSSVSILTDMGQSLKGWVPAPENEKHKDASPKNVRKNRNLFQKEEMECIQRERRKQERRLKKEKGRKERKRVSAACEQILATCKI